MLSSSDLERLIAVKKLELELEKTALGLSPQSDTPPFQEDKENAVPTSRVKKRVSHAGSRVLCERNDVIAEKKEKNEGRQEIEETIPPDLERYIRRYLGLPVMLKAGEYSPNNPLTRGARAPGDALLGLGEYERQRTTLRKIRQQEYREYLDEQAKKKLEAKEQAERERREREQREREREEREREILLERDRQTPERRRGSLKNVPVTSTVYCNNKVDTGVQVDGFSRPLSVAVQTDSPEDFRVTPSPTKSQLTEAERELSPRTVLEPHEKTWPPPNTWGHQQCRRRSYGDFDDRSSTFAKNRSKLLSELRHTHMPSIFDADAIRLRNLNAEKEAAERRQYYQQELKNQILEQQRIKEERKTREKMLEQAEMRRLEEQLRMLRSAQDCELGKQQHISTAMNDNTTQYNKKRTELQREIDAEQHKIIRVTAPNATTRKQDTTPLHKPSKLPFYYPKIQERSNEMCERKPYSLNIPENSIFSPSYDVDSYLRRNLNFDKEKILNRIDNDNNINRERCVRPTYTPTMPEYVTQNENSNLPKRIGTQNDEEINDRIKLTERIRQNEDTKDQRTNYGERQRHRDDMENIVINTIAERLRQKDDVPSIRNDETNVRLRQNDKDSVAIDRATNFDERLRQTDDARNIESKNENEEFRQKDDAKRFSEAVECRFDENRPIPSESDIIPVLKHTSNSTGDAKVDRNTSEKMKVVEDKWKVPAVQKNILKSMPNEEGRNVSILTQLGSIRRQLQLEQLKLDRIMSKDE